ncbi:MAG: gliding motility-associated C-terminal domain-containing protein, partial [Paludibacteraceae bacterium]|nr:gliding motility-associated C-terminal domain-containing protein [Paludibacteraceae bacterium]
HHSDTCSYWLTVVSDSLNQDTTLHYTPEIVCHSDTTIRISVLLAGYTPEKATSSDGIVENLFRQDEVLSLQAGEQMELRFVAHDTIDGSHHSDTCSYWLTVVPDSLNQDTMLHYTPEIVCHSDTTIRISVLLAGYTPERATSSDGKVESLFRQDEVLSLREGGQMELRFVAHDTIDGTHHSDTCSYWLTVVADDVEKNPLPFDTTLYYKPTIMCGHDTTITLSSLSTNFILAMPSSLDGVVYPLFRWEDLYALRAGERMELKFVAKDTFLSNLYNDTCSYWLSVVDDSCQIQENLLLCQSDTIVYLSHDQCELIYSAVYPISTNPNWKVILKEGLDGAMMRHEEFQRYTFVAKENGRAVASCSYRVEVRDTITSYFVECPDDLSFMASSDTAQLNIILDLPRLDKTCRKDTILMTLSDDEKGELFSDTISVKSNPDWLPISLTPGDYSVYWQLLHNGDVVDDCESSVKIGVRTISGIFVKDVQIHNYLLSPNGDGKNEFFVIEEIGNFPRNELVVFNQWGSIVYQKKNYDNSWSGRSNSNRTLQTGLLPMGTYFYVLLSEGKKVYSGYIELLY